MEDDMNVDGQKLMILGAMCIDEAFRNSLFAETLSADQVSSLVNAYGKPRNSGNDLDPAVSGHVWNIVRAGAPCRVATKQAMEQLQLAACPCWPC
jgi:hypothetical protein